MSITSKSVILSAVKAPGEFILTRRMPDAHAGVFRALILRLRLPAPLRMTELF
jgi:hypothetical protein